MERKPQILLVDADLKLGQALKSKLTELGFVAHFCDNPFQAARQLSKAHYDFLLCDMSMPLISGIELIMWAKKHAPRTQSMLMSQMPIEVVQMMAQQAGVLEIFNKPLDIEKLNDKLHNFFQTGLSGDLKHIQLADLLQILLLDKVNREIQIADKKNRLLGKLSLCQGELIHASLYDLNNSSELTGQAAFSKMAQMKKAQFSEQAYNPDLESNLQLDLQSLAMEAAQQIDETSQQSDQANPYLQNIGKVSRILLVDDDKDLRLLLNRQLSFQGFEVIEMEDAQQAVEHIQAHEIDFDLILTDVSMPRMNGLAFLLWLKENQIDRPVIMMTAYPSDEIREFAQNHSVLQFLSKPFQMQDLETSIAEIGETGLSGMIANINALDLIQLALMMGEQRCFQVTDALGAKGQLYIERNQILHAEFREDLGEAAFLALVTISNGRFEEVPWNTPKNLTLKETMPHKLLLKATRLLDEQNAFWPGSESLISEIEKKVDSHLNQDQT